MNKEEIEKYELFKNKYLQQPISLLTKHNLELLEEHCKKQLYHETGQRIREHETVLELIYRYKQLEKKVKEQEEIIKACKTQNINNCNDKDELIDILIKDKNKSLKQKQVVIEKLNETIDKANKIINDQEFRYIDEVIDEEWGRRKLAQELLELIQKGEWYE